MQERPETPRIAPQTWITEEQQDEGGEKVYLVFQLDENGNIGFGYVANDYFIELLQRYAESHPEKKEMLSSTKVGDLALTMGKGDINENEDGVSGVFSYGRLDGTRSQESNTVFLQQNP